MDNTKRNYRILIASVTLVVLILIYRAWELAFHSPVPLSMLPQKPTIKRGTIYDTQGHELAISRGTVSIGIRPDGIINPEKTASLIAASLNLNEKDILKDFKKNDNYYYLKKNVPLPEIKELQGMKLSGVVFEEKISRYYPNDHLASSILGFTGVDNEGLAGIEFEYNDYLTEVNDHEYIGDDVYLTLNAYVQHKLEKALMEGLKASKSRAATGIVADVHTGHILAMASLPDFDPNHAADYPGDAKRNRAIMENIEPGSTFKIFIIAALLKDNILDEQKTYFCPGYFKYKDHRLNCSSVHDKETLIDAIKDSCNTAVIEMAWPMPVMRLYEHMKQFGFTANTNINLPGEENGYMPPPEKWDISRKMSIPIGQGLSVTPIQLVMAANAIANGGMMLKPAIVERIVTADGKAVFEVKTENRYPVLSPAISRKLLSYLQHVVTQGGTGYLASIPDFPIAGKTSTAMKSDKSGYSKDKFQASFIGFFPGDRPEISIFIWYDEPHDGGHQGGQIAAPIFKNVLTDIIPIVHKGKIRNTTSLEDRKVTLRNYNKNIMPDLRGKSKKEALFILWSQYPGEHEIHGSGYLTHQIPAPGARIKDTSKFILTFQE